MIGNQLSDKQISCSSKEIKKLSDTFPYRKEKGNGRHFSKIRSRSTVDNWFEMDNLWFH